MRYIRRRGGARSTGGTNNSFWLSFSDLMSAMLLVFILIMFYSVYQYFDMLEVKTAELLRQSTILSEKETELSTKDAELTTAQEKLTASETLLVAEQAKLLLRDQELSSLSAALEAQKTELDTANTTLATQQAELEAAKSQLTTQQAELLAAQTLLADKELVVASQQELLDSQQKQLDELVGVRKRIIASLADALSQANISASVDATTGAITLDSSILFTSGDFTLSAEGKAMIDRFLPVYLNVLLSDEYRANVSEIIIEGHTDSVGNYMDNLRLSQNRALAVASYILADEYTGISAATKRVLRQIVTANGRSESNLIYREDGSEDSAASRRVEFKFRLQDEQMIDQMVSLLANMDEQAAALAAGTEGEGTAEGEPGAAAEDGGQAPAEGGANEDAQPQDDAAEGEGEETERNTP